MDNEHSLFISYARADSRWVIKFVNDLHEMGYNPWLDIDSIRLGQTWRDEIWNGIREAAFILIVVSPNSAASKMVQNELDDARREHKPIVPIIIGEGMSELGVHDLQGVDFRNQRYDTALAELAHKLGLAVKPRPKAALRDKIQDGSQTFGTLSRQWRSLSFGNRDDDPVAIRYDLHETGTAAYLVGRKNQTIKPPETVQVFLQFTGRLSENTFEDYLDYVQTNRYELHTVLIRGPFNPAENEYWLPIDKEREEAWKSIVDFVLSAIDHGMFGARRLAIFLNTPNALSVVLGHRLKLKLPYEIYYYTGRDRQRDMYVKVYEYQR